jgi:hypothetical protein
MKYAFAFSLTEVLLAVGILAVGMLFIAGVFPVSVHFTTIAAERTIAATVADEAFAKIKLYGISDANLSYVSQNLYENVSGVSIPSYEFAYPSVPTADITSKKYWWSAVCRRISPSDVQVTVFVCRKVGVSGGRPVAVRVPVVLNAGVLQITNVPDRRLINDGYTIVDNETGGIYRVLERYGTLPNPESLRLDKLWQGSANAVWVVPPPSSAGGGRYPCIAVYQKVMRF